MRFEQWSGKKRVTKITSLDEYVTCERQKPINKQIQFPQSNAVKGFFRKTDKLGCEERIF